jgi:hypothetical protein
VPGGVRDEPEDSVGVDRAPICPYCGVTALPGELAHVIDVHFVCDNAGCEAYAEVVES